MASEKILEIKKQQMSELREKLLTMESVILADYRGLTVAQDTAMRAEMRNANVDYRVIKNRLLKKTVEGTKFEGLMPHLEGPTAVGMSEDEIAAAKIMSKYASMKNYGNFKIKAGFIDGQVIDVEGIEVYAKIPPKNDLLAMLMGGMKAPITALALVLKAIMEKKDETAA